jgi:streptogramin lyase
MKNRRTHRLRYLSRWATFLLGYISFVACTNVTSTPTFPTQTAVSITDTSTPLPVSSPTPIATQTKTALKLRPQVVVLAANLPEPDDLLLAPDGSILISDVKDGTIKQYGPDGQLHLVLSGLNEPEGMALGPDGSLIIAEQGNNRLVRYDFASKTLRPFLNLVNHTVNLGVDNIIGNGTNLIVPDSPNGTLLEVSWDGKTVRRLASGLVRPTGAWVEADGNILLADEYGNAVLRLHTDGALEKVADLSTPDDVIADASGNVFAVTLGDGAIHLITAGQSQDVVLVGGLSSPQGMIFDRDGNLIVTDPGHHELIKVIIH